PFAVPLARRSPPCAVRVHRLPKPAAAPPPARAAPGLRAAGRCAGMPLPLRAAVLPDPPIPLSPGLLPVASIPALAAACPALPPAIQDPLRPFCVRFPDAPLRLALSQSTAAWLRKLPCCALPALSTPVAGDPAAAFRIPSAVAPRRGWPSLFLLAGAPRCASRVAQPDPRSFQPALPRPIQPAEAPSPTSPAGAPSPA